jgi:hypothetical protein
VADARHTESAYDEMLARGEERQEARALVRHDVEDVLARWARGELDSRQARP